MISLGSEPRRARRMLGGYHGRPHWEGCDMRSGSGTMGGGCWHWRGCAGQALAAQPSEQQVRQLIEVMHVPPVSRQMNNQMAA
jgi:hypothetical protein